RTKMPTQDSRQGQRGATIGGKVGQAALDQQAYALWYFQFTGLDGSLPALARPANLALEDERTNNFTDEERIPFSMAINLSSKTGMNTVSSHIYQQLVYLLPGKTLWTQLFAH